MGLEPFNDKWTSFGWEVIETDGHNLKQLKGNLMKAIEIDKPVCLIGHTTKGKGVSFMEDSVLWHYRTPVDEEYLRALEELQKEI